MAHAGGRPTLYSPDTIRIAEEYLKTAIPENMQIPTIEGLAIRLDVTRETLYDWGRTYPKFSDTIRKMKILQKEALVMTGIFGGKEINPSIIALLLKVNHGMIEKTAVDVTSGGKPILGGKSVSGNDSDPQTGTTEKED